MINVEIYGNDSYCETLKESLKRMENIEVMSTHSAPRQQYNYLPTPDVIVMDITPSDKRQLQSFRDLKNIKKSTKVIVLTEIQDRQTIINYIDAGVDGFISKKTTISMIGYYITAAFHGGFPMCPTMAKLLLRPGYASQNRPSALDNLTARERDILMLLMNGNSYKLIGAELHITLNTVRSHIRKIYQKLSINSKSEAVAISLREHYTIATQLHK